MKLVPEAKSFTLLMFFCYALFLLSILWVEDQSHAINLYLKNSIYFFFFLLLNDFFIDTIKDGNKRLIKYAKLSILIFIIFNVLVSIKIGENIFIKAIVGVFNENAVQANYRYFFKLVNFNILTFDFTTWGEDEFHVPSYRNVFGIAVIIIYAIIDSLKKKTTIDKAAMIFLLFLLLLSQSRSAIIIFVIIFVTKYLVNNNNKKLFLWFLIIPIVMLSLIFVVDIELFKRFTEFSDDTRLEMFVETGKQIKENFLFGKGFGSVIESNNKVFHVHNFIMASFYSSGILGLFFSLLVIVELFIQLSNRIRFNKQSYQYFFYYGFPLLIIFRMMVGGNNGLPSFHDWVALSLFFVFLNKTNNKPINKPNLEH